MTKEATCTCNRVEKVYMCLKQRKSFDIQFNSGLNLSIPEKMSRMYRTFLSVSYNSRKQNIRDTDFES